MTLIENAANAEYVPLKHIVSLLDGAYPARHSHFVPLSPEQAA